MTGPVKIRQTDLYVTENVHQPGIVLVGDAFATACPTSGTGASKAIVDVERLCNVYVPEWLGSSGMGVDKIAAFYADPVKVRSDLQSMKTSLFAKRLATETEFRWAAYRLMRFAGSAGMGLLEPWDVSEEPAAAHGPAGLARGASPLRALALSPLAHLTMPRRGATTTAPAVESYVPQHLRPSLPRHHLGREPRAGDRLRGRRLPARASR